MHIWNNVVVGNFFFDFNSFIYLKFLIGFLTELCLYMWVWRFFFRLNLYLPTCLLAGRSVQKVAQSGCVLNKDNLRFENVLLILFTNLAFFQGPLTCDAIALAVPAVFLIVSDARIFKEPLIRGSLPKADLAMLLEVSPEAPLATLPPLNSGSSITPETKQQNFQSSTWVSSSTQHWNSHNIHFCYYEQDFFFRSKCFIFGPFIFIKVKL